MIQHYIEQTFGVDYTLSDISRMLKRLGLKKLRPKTVPGKQPRLEEQVSFIDNYHQLKSFALKDPGIVQLFGDAMHLHHQVVPTLIGGDPTDPPILNTNSNRKRLNVLGAFFVADCQFIHHSSEKNCDGERVIEFLEKILQVYPQKHSIVLYLDNATYFYSPIVREWLEQHPKLIIEHLPTSAPNLNLIARLWRLVKEKLVANRYYEKYKTFRAKAFQILNHLDDSQQELESLITENFQIIWKIKCQNKT